jgi:hypothetical protein
MPGTSKTAESAGRISLRGNIWLNGRLGRDSLLFRAVLFITRGRYKKNMLEMFMVSQIDDDHTNGVVALTDELVECSTGTLAPLAPAHREKSRKEVLQNQIGAACILLAVTALPRKSLFFSAGTSLLYTFSTGGT